MFLLFLAIITLYLLRKANKYLKLKTISLLQNMPFLYTLGNHTELWVEKFLIEELMK